LAIGQVSARVMPVTCCTLRDDGGLQVVEGFRADAHDHLVRAGDVLGGQHPRKRGELFGDDRGAAHLGLDQHESLDHPLILPVAA
jgi:hypothetical protein